MKKLFLFFGILLLNVNVFANAKINEKEVGKNNFFGCCTATITYQGSYFDHATSCGIGSGSSYCHVSLDKLRERYPFLFEAQQVDPNSDPNNPQGLPTLMPDGSIVYPDGTIIYPEDGPWEEPGPIRQ
jgi:hypothetical protein